MSDASDDTPRQIFEKIALVRPDGQMIDAGTLAAHSDRLEFDGKRTKATIPDIRGVAMVSEHLQADSFAKATRLKVTHGTGDNLSTIYIHKLAAGFPKKVREAQRVLYESLRGIYGETSLPGADQQRMASVEDTAREAKLRGARRSIWVGALLMAAGGLLTIITFSNRGGGGTYYVFYGLLLAGLVPLVSGLMGVRRYRPPSA
ncbi:MAG: hypothetical protein ACRDH9_03955 [Actinomycetota bacterium]